MNVAVIPFLIGASVFVKNDSEWILGPVLVFQMNKTITVSMNVIEEIIATVECRSTSSLFSDESSENVQNTSLVCHAKRIRIARMVYEYNETDAELQTEIRGIGDQLFEMQFCNQGRVCVYSMKKDEIERKLNSDIIMDIIEQFHNEILNIGPRNSMRKYENIIFGKYVISSFTENVDTVRGKGCSSKVTVSYTANQFREGDRFRRQESDFDIKLLPMSYTNPADKTFSIRRNRTKCDFPPPYVDRIREEKLYIDNLTQYYSEMVIDDITPKFTSYTHLEGTAFLANETKEETYEFTEHVHLTLLRIKPASKVLDRDMCKFKRFTMFVGCLCAKNFSSPFPCES